MPLPIAPPPSRGASFTQKFLRPNNVTAYTAIDVVGPYTTSGGAVLVFPNMGPPNAEILTATLLLQRDVAALVSTESTYSLHLYSAIPPSLLADNAAFDIAGADQDLWLGTIGIAAFVDQGSTLTSQNPGGLTMKLGPSGNLYAYLVTTAGYTPVAFDPYKLSLHVTWP